MSRAATGVAAALAMATTTAATASHATTAPRHPASTSRSSSRARRSSSSSSRSSTRSKTRAPTRSRTCCSRILHDQAERQGTIYSGGVLSVVDDGFGFLRGERLVPGPNDVYVSQSQVRRFALRNGDYVTGQVRQPKDSEKYYGLLRVEAVNGVDPEVARLRPKLRGAHPDLPERDAAPGDRQHRAEPAHRRPLRAGRSRPAWAHCLAAEGGQDDAAQVDRPRHRPEQPRGPPHGAARRRAPGGGDRHAALCARRGDRLDLRRARRGAHPRRRGRDRSGRGGWWRAVPTSRHPDGLDHPPRPRLQPRDPVHRADPLGRPRPDRALPAEALLRLRAQDRGEAAR